MNFQKPKGTADLLYPESVKWQYVESVARHLFSTYQFHEVRTPIFEHYEVFARSVGDSSDIVTKEMYDFFDKGDRHITLRPEGTAGVVRAFVEHKLYGPDQPNPYKSYYIGPMFRYERPQSGRFRQFHQIGVEVFGVQNPAVDVETMALALSFFQAFGAKHLKLVINSLGDKETREAYRQALIDYLTPYSDKLSYDSQKRLLQNPLRVLDSKNAKDKEIVQDAPSILDYLSEDSQYHFEQVKFMLAAIGIDYEVDNRMVRGLDYYTHTIFEIMSDAPGFGAITTVCAGGRYDGLVQELGGPDVPGIGFAIGLERVLITLEAEGITLPIDESIDIFVVGLGETTNSEALKLVQTARLAGLSAERDYLGKKAKAQFKLANKLSANYVLTIGEDELTAHTVNIKNMATGIEQLVSLDSVYDDIRTTIESV